MKIHILHTAPTRQLFIFTLPILLLSFVLLYSIFGQQAQQFSNLAQSFLHGRLYFLHSIGGVGYDPIPYKGHQYWGEGLFPAIILLPFAAIAGLFSVFFQQGYIDWLLVLGTLYFVYALARKFKYDVEDSLILMFGWGLGSAFVGIAASSSGWSFAQVVTTFLLFWSLYEYFTRKRWWLIGVICGSIFLTRATATPIVLFYGLEVWSADNRKLQLTRYTPLAIPLIGAMCIQGIYNYLRFHSPFNGGYEYQLLSADSAESRALGVFSIKHIPANLYSLVLGTPQAIPMTSTSWSLKFPFIRNNSYGLSIFLTSPYFLYLFGRQWKVFSSTARHLVVAAGISCIGVLCFYGIGRDQFGYRYSLDFLPELFVVLMLVYRVEHERLSRGMKVLLLGSGVVNWWILLSYLF